MSGKVDCADYWCDYYGKGSEKCDRCVKKDGTKDKSDLNVVLKRRADRLMDSLKGINKGQER